MRNLLIKKEIDMTEGPVFSKILLFSIPLILTNLLQTLYNAADMMVVGRFSAVNGAVGAIGATSSLSNIFLNLIMGASTGATVVVANALGAKDRERTERAVHTSVMIS
ncbi:MAG: MATE family efflux transporter, partial [Clostridia bacterium]|nr:MATE family efflux transporter [Clostridia bacterium]